MQHDLFRSDHDLYLTSNFQNGLWSKYSSFDASRQEKHDAGKMNVVPLLRRKLLQKKRASQKRLLVVCSLEVKPLILGQSEVTLTKAR